MFPKMTFLKKNFGKTQSSHCLVRLATVCSRLLSQSYQFICTEKMWIDIKDCYIFKESGKETFLYTFGN